MFNPPIEQQALSSDKPASMYGTWALCILSCSRLKEQSVSESRQINSLLSIQLMICVQLNPDLGDVLHKQTTRKVRRFTA